METLGTAQLAEEIPTERAVATIVRRADIEEALRDPGAPELRLDLARRAAGSAERESIGIGWSRDDLERLLEGAAGEEIVLTFDEDELAIAFDEVEAHGLRRRGLVFAVAAAGALGSGATVANAMPIIDPGPAGYAPAPAVHHVTGTPQTTGGDEIVGVPSKDVVDGLIAGGVIVAIAGATFAGARRMGTARPA